jgi:hypothetical protein
MELTGETDSADSEYGECRTIPFSIRNWMIKNLIPRQPWIWLIITYRFLDEAR